MCKKYNYNKLFTLLSIKICRFDPLQIANDMNSKSKKTHMSSAKKIIDFKNKILIVVLSFFDKYNRILRITMPIIIMMLAIWLTQIILAPIQFAKETEYRYNFIKERLIDIRSAQLAYKDINGQFTNDFNDLITCIKKDSFILVQKTDSLVDFYNAIYKEYMLKDSTFIDTLGKVSILDSLFSTNYPIDSLAYIPPFNKMTFEMQAGVITKSKIDVPVFEVRDPKPYDPDNRLMIGSMTEANLNGNWQ